MNYSSENAKGRSVSVRTFPNDYSDINDSFHADPYFRLHRWQTRRDLVCKQIRLINITHGNAMNRSINVFVKRQQQIWDFKSTFFYVSALSKASCDIDLIMINDEGTSSFISYCSVVCSYHSENNYYNGNILTTIYGQILNFILIS